MSASQSTRQRILEKAASLFNRKGFSGAALSDIMRETGLQKGGIYNHFASKEALALESFDYAVGRVERWFAGRLAGKKGADEKLLALVESFRDYAKNPPVPKKCPILNTSVESDDAHPALRKRTQEALDRFLGRLIRIIDQGKEEGTLRPDADSRTVALVLTASFEGALMMSRLYGDTDPMERVADHLRQYLKRDVFAV